MKAVILAGGLGTRLSEETVVKPKPLVEVGGMPILWHIMKGYSAFGVTEFVILAGYKSYHIKEFFRDYTMRFSSVKFNQKTRTMEVISDFSEPWEVTVLDTGLTTNTGGRLLRAKEHIDDEKFFFTYGDGVANVDFAALLEHHNAHNATVTLTAVQPPGRFGALRLSSDQHTVEQFNEKPVGDGAWINGGFFVVEPEAIDEIEFDDTAWEEKPLETIAKKGKLNAYKHSDFWQSMDTLRDKHKLEAYWNQGSAPWKVWSS